MSKKKQNKKVPTPRNPFVQHLINKKQGSHGVSKKAQRRKDKEALKKEYFIKAFA